MGLKKDMERLARERGRTLGDVEKQVARVLRAVGVEVAVCDERGRFLCVAVLEADLALGERDCGELVRAIDGHHRIAADLLPLFPENLDARLRAALVRVLLKADLHAGYRLSACQDDEARGRVEAELKLSVLEAEYLVELYRATMVVGFVRPGNRNATAPGAGSAGQEAMPVPASADGKTGTSDRGLTAAANSARHCPGELNTGAAKTSVEAARPSAPRAAGINGRGENPSGQSGPEGKAAEWECPCGTMNHPSRRWCRECHDKRKPCGVCSTPSSVVLDTDGVPLCVECAKACAAAGGAA
jgi:hypothetical protein